VNAERSNRLKGKERVSKVLCSGKNYFSTAKKEIGKGEKIPKKKKKVAQDLKGEKSNLGRRIS